MSHTVKVDNVKVDNLDALHKAAKKLGLEVSPLPKEGIRFYDRTQYKEGVMVQIPGWNYPVIFEPNGEVKFDNYGGAWGKQEELDKLLQRYTTEEDILLAEENGWLVNESLDAKTGDIVLDLEENDFL